jgi:DNA end-binding protein Ku
MAKQLRSIWSGSISFGLVNVPVRMYSAIADHDLHFHLLHTEDNGRIGYEKVCKKEQVPVPDEEIGKAYELRDGTFVYLGDEDFQAAEGRTYRTIDLTDFVPYDDIDPIYFERTFYLGPAEGGEKVYSLLVRAMEKSGLAGIGTFVMRDRQHLGCLRVRERVLTLERMYFADEVRPVGDIDVEAARVGKRELEMADDLIERFSGPFEISKYRDDYRDRLLAVIEDKRRGREIHVEEPEEDRPTDLVEALRASIQASTRKRRSSGGSRRSANGGGSTASKRELVERAKRRGLRGYSSMTKDELAAALKRS